MATSTAMTVPRATPTTLAPPPASATQHRRTSHCSERVLSGGTRIPSRDLGPQWAGWGPSRGGRGAGPHLRRCWRGGASVRSIPGCPLPLGASAGSSAGGLPLSPRLRGSSAGGLPLSPRLRGSSAGGLPLSPRLRGSSAGGRPCLHACGGPPQVVCPCLHACGGPPAGGLPLSPRLRGSLPSEVGLSGLPRDLRAPCRSALQPTP